MGIETTIPFDRRATRRRDTRTEIVDAAWDLCRSEGLNALTMRALGQRVGLRAQSIYSYFPSKHAIYDAMFAAANEEFVEVIDAAFSTVTDDDDPVARATIAMDVFVGFSVSDPTRFELMFQRTIPGFEPSPDSYAVAERALDAARRQLATIGVVDQSDVDLWTAVATGLASQQIANDPDGDRWSQLTRPAVSMLLDHITTTSPGGTP